MSENVEPLPYVTVDAALCGTLGVCELQAPTYFEILDDGTLRVAEGPIPDVDLVSVRGAVESCPNRALRLVTDSLAPQPE